MNQIVNKMPHLKMLKNPSKKFLETDPETDDLLNLIERFFSKDKSVTKFSC